MRPWQVTLERLRYQAKMRCLDRHELAELQEAEAEEEAYSGSTDQAVDELIGLFSDLCDAIWHGLRANPWPLISWWAGGVIIALILELANR